MHSWKKVLVDSQNKLDDAVNFLSTCDSLAWDTETTGLGRFDKICGICVAGARDAFLANSYYIPIRHDPPPYTDIDKQTTLFSGDDTIFKVYPDITNLDPDIVFNKIKPLTKKKAIFHNSRFDLKQFEKDDVPQRSFQDLEDTYLLNYLQDSRRARTRGALKLENVFTRLFNKQTEGEGVLKRWALEHGAKKSNWKGMMAKFPLQLLYIYATDDVEQTYEIFYHEEMQEIKQGFLNIYNTELKVIRQTVEMMLRGIPVDEEWGKKVSEIYEEEKNNLTREIQDLTGVDDFNPGSSDQLGQYLMKQGYSLSYTDKGNISTKESVLKEIDDPVVDKILRYRTIQDNQSKYIEGFLDLAVDGYLYPDWRTMSVETGRLSSDSMQIIPKRDPESKKICRGLFYNDDPDYIWVGFDFSQLQIRLGAHVSKDPTLIDIYRQQKDVHTQTAKFIFEYDSVDDVSNKDRQAGKGVNFACMFGAGAKRLQEQLYQDWDMEISYDRAEEIVKRFKRSYNKVAQSYWKMKKKADRQGYLKNRFGRKRILENYSSRAYNTIIQSLEADLMKIAMNRLYDLYTGRKTHVLMQIHDELVIKFHKDELDDLFFPTIDAFQRWQPPYDWRVPIRVGVSFYGYRWSHEIESSVDACIQHTFDVVKDDIKSKYDINSIGELLTNSNSQQAKNLRKLQDHIMYIQDTQSYLRYFVRIVKRWRQAAEAVAKEKKLSQEFMTA